MGVVVGTVNWESVAVIVASVFTSAAIIGRWVTWAAQRADNARTEDTRKIVLEALGQHMVNEESQRAKEARRAKRWRREIKGQIGELRGQVGEMREQVVATRVEVSGGSGNTPNS